MFQLSIPSMMNTEKVTLYIKRDDGHEEENSEWKESAEKRYFSTQIKSKHFNFHIGVCWLRGNLT